MNHRLSAFFIGLLIASPFYRTGRPAYALSTNELQVSEPAGGEILLGKNLFQRMVEGGIKDSYIFSQLIPFLIKWGIRLAVGLSVLALIFGGYQFVAALGDTEKRQTAQKTITYALVGLVLSLTAFGIVTIISRITLV